MNVNQNTSLQNAEKQLLTNDQTINDQQIQLSYALVVKLCALGFFMNFQPSESYLSKYLQDTKHLSESQIDIHIWPYDTYGSLISLLPIGLCAEHYGFRSVIFFGLLCRECTRFLLLYGTQLWQMSLMQCTYAMAISVNWVYFAYIYMVITQPSHYQSVTSFVQSALLLGTFLSSLFAQFLVTYTDLARDYTSLFYVSWVSTSLALLSFFILPKPNRTSPVSVFKIIKTKGFSVMFKYIQNMYFEHSGVVLMWSIWWIGAYAAYSVYSNYYQNQFIEYNKDNGDGYYGLVNAAIELASVIGSLVPVYHSWRHRHSVDRYSSYKIWIVYSFEIIILSSIVCAVVLFIPVMIRNLYVSYICNCIVFGVYHFQNACGCSCIAYALDHNYNESNEYNEIAGDVNINDHHYYAMIFTFNSFLGLLLATVAQIIGGIMIWTTSLYYTCCAIFYILSIIVLVLSRKKVRQPSLVLS